MQVLWRGLVIRVRRAEQRLAKWVATMIEKATNELDAICINDYDEA